VNSWRGFLGARDAYQRLDALLQAVPVRDQPMPLPAPRGALSLERVVVTPPGAPAPVIKGVSLAVEPGSMLAVIGPSAAGKSTLVRTMLGLFTPVAGSTRLDGAELAQWDREALGRYVGYLPQDVELLDGTISENIARFGAIDAEGVVEAARAAGVHDMILRLPDGYDTQLIGNIVSAGQRQRIGIARALYGDPQVIVLDEPNSNLDEEGDAALARTLTELKRSGRTVVVVTHRRNILGQCDKILVMADGQIALHGERDKVLTALKEAATREQAQARANRAVLAEASRQAE
jgi:ABC-type protease/lipase transport system fused ATPase/permease subunit